MKMSKSKRATVWLGVFGLYVYENNVLYNESILYKYENATFKEYLTFIGYL